MIIYILFLNLARFAIARMYGLSASVSLCVAFRRLFFSLRPRAPRMLNEMEASKVVKVSVIIHDKYLDDLKGFVTEKGGSVESSETSDVNAACDPGCSDAVPDAEALVPKEIASKICRWLQRNSVPQKVFAEKILHRSQGSFSDYMSKAPSTMPKTHGRAVWQELNDFLQSEEKQEELLQQLREGKLNNPVTVHIFLNISVNMLKELKVKKIIIIILTPPPAEIQGKNRKRSAIECIQPESSDFSF